MAMPITTHPDQAELYRDPQHWHHVMENLFDPALRAAGYEPVAPSARGSQIIQAHIIKKLVEADLVLADLSSLNPNVLYELGVRTSLNKPLVLVADEHTFGKLPFDTSSINTHPYDSRLQVWEMLDQIESLRTHVEDTEESGNPMWRHFGVELTAEAPALSDNPREARLQLLSEQMERVLARAERAERAEMKRQAIALISEMSSVVPPAPAETPPKTRRVRREAASSASDIERRLLVFRSRAMQDFPEIERGEISAYDDAGPELILVLRSVDSMARTASRLAEVRAAVSTWATAEGLGERVSVHRGPYLIT